MTTAVLVVSASGRPAGLGAKNSIQTKPTSELVNANAIQERFATKRTSNAHSSVVVPPSETTLYIWSAP